jgi:hypothetical protein
MASLKGTLKLAFAMLALVPTALMELLVRTSATLLKLNTILPELVLTAAPLKLPLACASVLASGSSKMCGRPTLSSVVFQFATATARLWIPLLP